MTDDPQPALRMLHLRNFKGFRNLRVPFRSLSVLVGPNSAGKSTIVEAVSAVAAMLAHAKRTRPEFMTCAAWSGWGFKFRTTDFVTEDDNLRYNFDDEREVRLDATFGNRAKLTAVWPGGEDPEPPYFFLTAPSGVAPREPRQVRDLFPTIGVVPPLSPLEHREKLLTDKYITEMVSTRLSSKHFRNHLQRLQYNPMEEFRTLMDEYASEIVLENVTSTISPEDAVLDAYYHEVGDRTSKELCWAGDGVQVWLQFLYHIGRLSGCSMIVLDEPDVYLHADLQKRLVILLQNAKFQSLIATHSFEVMGQADADQLVWVDRNANRAVILPRSRRVDEFSESMGTAFNMGLAKALRSKAILFVEGEDKKILSQLAARLGASRVEQERSLAIVPLSGSTNWSRLVSFDWLARRFLNDSVSGMVVLDRDFHTDSFRSRVTNQLNAEARIEVKFWGRHELESYLLVPSVIARLTGVAEAEVRAIMLQVAETNRQRWLDAARVMVAEDEGLRQIEPALKLGKDWLEEWWGDPDERLRRVPAKELLAGLNDTLQSRRIRAVSFSRLARAIRRDEIDPEVADLVMKLEKQAGGS